MHYWFLLTCQKAGPIMYLSMYQIQSCIFSEESTASSCLAWLIWAIIHSTTRMIMVLPANIPELVPELLCLREESYLGLVQFRSRCDMPPPHVLEHDDHLDHSDQPPWIGLGPSSPYFTHWPPRHHCNRQCFSVEDFLSAIYVDIRKCERF